MCIRSIDIFMYRIRHTLRYITQTNQSPRDPIASI